MAAASPGLTSAFKERESGMSEASRGFTKDGFTVTSRKECISEGLLS